MKKNYFLFILQIIFTCVLVVLPFLKNQIDKTKSIVWKEVLLYIDSNVLIIALISSVFLTILTTIEFFYFPFSVAKKIRSKVLNIIVHELFKGDNRDTRVTIFRDASKFRNFWYNLITKYNSKNKIGIRKRIRKKFRRKYIYVIQRIATQYPTSKAYFSFSDNKDECQGVAGVIRHDFGFLEIKDLPDIRNIDLNNSEEVKKRVNLRNINEYIHKSYLRDPETLKRLNIRALHFGGTLIQGEFDEPKGVLLVDSCCISSPFTDEIKKKIENYSTIIGMTMR